MSSVSSKTNSHTNLVDVGTHGSARCSTCEVFFRCFPGDIDIDRRVVVEMHFLGRTGNLMFQLMYAYLYAKHVGAVGIVPNRRLNRFIYPENLERLASLFRTKLKINPSVRGWTEKGALKGFPLFPCRVHECGSDTNGPRMSRHPLKDCRTVQPPKYTIYYQNYMFYNNKDIRHEMRAVWIGSSGDDEGTSFSSSLSPSILSYALPLPKRRPGPMDVVVHYRKCEFSHTWPRDENLKHSSVPPFSYFANILEGIRKRRGRRERAGIGGHVYFITEPKIRGDPTLKRLMDEYGATCEIGNDELDDMRFAASGEGSTLVLTYGTFSWMTAYLSFAGEIHVPYLSNNAHYWFPAAALFVHDDPRYVYHDVAPIATSTKKSSRRQRRTWLSALEVLDRDETEFSKAVRERHQSPPWISSVHREAMARQHLDWDADGDLNWLRELRETTTLVCDDDSENRNKRKQASKRFSVEANGHVSHLDVQNNVCGAFRVRRWCFESGVFSQEMAAFCTCFVAEDLLGEEYTDNSKSGEAIQKTMSPLGAIVSLAKGSSRSRIRRAEWMRYVFGRKRGDDDENIRYRWESVEAGNFYLASSQDLQLGSLVKRCVMSLAARPVVGIEGLRLGYSSGLSSSSLSSSPSSYLAPPSPAPVLSPPTYTRNAALVIVAFFTSDAEHEGKARRLVASCKRLDLNCFAYEVRPSTGGKIRVHVVDKGGNVADPLEVPPIVTIDVTQNAVGLKPWFILNAMQSLHPHQPILYVDVDMVFRSEPKDLLREALLHRGAPPCRQKEACDSDDASSGTTSAPYMDVMVYDWNALLRLSTPIPYNLVTTSAVIYVAPTDRAIGFISDWAATSGYHKNTLVADDHLFNAVYDFSICAWSERLQLGRLSKAYVRYRTLDHFADVATAEIVLDHPDPINAHAHQIANFVLPQWADGGTRLEGVIVVKM